MNKAAFFDTKPYDRIYFDALKNDYGVEIEYFESKLNPRTAVMAKGAKAVIVFVNDDVGAETISVLKENGVEIIAMRCAGYNNVDLAAAKGVMPVVRVPEYSPHAVAEHTMAMLLTSVRRIHKAYNRTREFNFSLNGLTGFDLYGKTVGVVGTGKIGRIFIDICKGFGMKVAAYDVYQNPSLDFVEYMPLNEVLKTSDLISLHCPLTEESYHLINTRTISMMKANTVLVNTSRGALVNTEDLIKGIRSRKFHGVGLDVYEEETRNVFENRQDDILETSVTARLLSFPNVIVTSHQGFFTDEALAAISRVTLENASAFSRGEIIKENLVESF